MLGANNLRPVHWNSLITRIKEYNCTPIISELSFFSSNNELVTDFIELWARKEKLEYLYNSNDKMGIAQFSQYLHVLEYPKDKLALETSFLHAFEEYLSTLKTYQVDLNLSEKVWALNEFDEEKNPLSILAQLPISIYLTTSYFETLEIALRKVDDKEPETEIYYWNDALEAKEENISPFKKDPDYIPSVERPLVYHLYGLDTIPESLVLTEDNFIDFLRHVSLNNNSKIQHFVSRKLASNSLIMMGFDLDTLDFKITFHGLVKAKDPNYHRPLRKKSLAIQLVPGMKQVEAKVIEKMMEYLEKYFNEPENFLVFWGSPGNFTEKLWKYWID